MYKTGEGERTSRTGYVSQLSYYEARNCAGCPLRCKCHNSENNRRIEAVFGQMKSNNKFTRFTLRGIEKVKLEFGLMAIAHNLRKMVRKMTGKYWKNLIKTY